MEKDNEKDVKILSRTQAKVVQKLRGSTVKQTAVVMGMTPEAVSMNTTRIYQRFLGLLNLMLDDYPIFERRFKSNKTAYTQLRKLARRVKGEVK